MFRSYFRFNCCFLRSGDNGHSCDVQQFGVKNDRRRGQHLKTFVKQDKIPVMNNSKQDHYFCSQIDNVYTVKKGSQFPVPRRDITTKLSLGGNNDVITELFLPKGSLVSAIPAGDGKLVNLFYGVPLFPHLRGLFSLCVAAIGEGGRGRA
jgi:hypothetical protein